MALCIEERGVPTFVTSTVAPAISSSFLILAACSFVKVRSKVNGAISARFFASPGSGGIFKPQCLESSYIVS